MRTYGIAKTSHSSIVRPFFTRLARTAGFFSTPAPLIQTKLTMGAPGDRFEQEADAMADRVVQRIPGGAVGAGATPAVQAKCAECLEEEKVQRLANAPVSMAVPGSVQQTLQGGAGGGQSMSGAIRDQMESAFGTDFSDVRLHTGASAAQLNRDLQANAFTYGTDVYFDSGKYEPDSSRGKHLLAHELTHVVQQAHRGVDPGLAEPVDSHAEREAHDISARVVRGEQAPMARAVPGGITRDVGWARRGPIPDAYGMGYNTILSRAGAAAEPAVRDLASCEDARMDLDVVRFQSLSLAGRRAVLGLKSHAAGTACEPWFPKLEPARLTDAQIEVTAEFQAYMDSKLEWQTKHKMTREEALLAGRLILRQLTQGGSISWSTDAGLFMNLARKQLGVLKAAERQVGTLNWVPFDTGAAVSNPSALPTEFGRWVLAGEAQPNAVSGRINCWEMILFGAYKGGFLTFSRIQSIYKLAVDNVRDGKTQFVGDTVETELRRGSVNSIDPASPTSPEPLPGDMVIFNTAATHAAISLGTKNTAGEHQVLSLWNQPNATSHVQKTTIEALLVAAGSNAKPVRFWSANW